MDQPKLAPSSSNQENHFHSATGLSENLEAMMPSSDQLDDHKDVGEGTVAVDTTDANSTTAAEESAEVPKPKHRRVAGLKLKANAKPASNDGLRRFALCANHAANASDTPPRVSDLFSKELPKLFASDRIYEWRGFELERTPHAMLELEKDAIPYQYLDHFLTQVYEAIADGPDGPICEDRYLVWSKVTREIMQQAIDPARKDGTVPKAARFTHFVPSNILIIKIPVDCHSSAGYMDIISKQVIGWACGEGLGRNLKTCGNTRYMAKVRESAVEGVDFDNPHPALERIAKSNPGIVDGFGSFNECDMAFRPFRMRPYKFDTPSVVVESSFGADYSMIRYKACWWLQLMCGEVKAVILINVDPTAQEIIIEVWRNEEGETYSNCDGPNRVQKIVITKKDEFKGCKEEADPDHYKVEGGPLLIDFKDFFLEGEDSQGLNDAFFRELPTKDHYGFMLGEDKLAEEAADLWYGDGELVNDWVEGLLPSRTKA